MKNLKPSEMPANTVIDTEEGEFIKRVEGYWEDMFSGCGHCSDSVRVSDVGCTDIHIRYQMGLTNGKTSDEYFGNDFEVIAVPPGFVFDAVELHGEWVRENGAYADGTKSHSCKGYICEES